MHSEPSARLAVQRASPGSGSLALVTGNPARLAPTMALCLAEGSTPRHMYSVYFPVQSWVTFGQEHHIIYSVPAVHGEILNRGCPVSLSKSKVAITGHWAITGQVTLTQWRRDCMHRTFTVEVTRLQVRVAAVCRLWRGQWTLTYWLPPPATSRPGSCRAGPRRPQ